MSSLQSLVCWYQEHSHSCPHEPRLRALEPQPDLSTAAVWQCDSSHAFVQYLCSPQWEAGDSEQEEGGAGGRDGDGTVAKASRRRRKVKGAERQLDPLFWFSTE